MSTPGPDNSLRPTHDDGDRFAPLSLAQQSPSKRVTKSHTPTYSAAAAPARRTFFDPWNSSSTGHQRAENRLSGSTSWRASRSLKLGEQYKAGLSGGGKRVADTVGAGSEDFGNDGRKEDGGWEKGAKGLRTGGQKSLADVWSVRKAGKKTPPEEKHLRVVHHLAEERGTSIGNLHCMMLQGAAAAGLRSCTYNRFDHNKFDLLTVCQLSKQMSAMRSFTLLQHLRQSKYLPAYAST
jgi:hypothetical protein